MTTGTPALEPSQESRATAIYLASVVRNAMEGFHCKHLTDAQMRELNPIIRNAIYTGLQALSHYHKSTGARAFVEHQRALIPHYWEPPELLADFRKSVALLEAAVQEADSGRHPSSSPNQ